MSSQLRLAVLSVVLLAVVFAGAYALASGGDDAPGAGTPRGEGAAPSAIATPDGVEVSDAPRDGSDLPDLGVPTRTPTPSSTPGGEATAQPTSQPTAQPTSQPTAQPTATPAPTTFDEDIGGGGED